MPGKVPNQVDAAKLVARITRERLTSPTQWLLSENLRRAAIERRRVAGEFTEIKYVPQRKMSTFINPLQDFHSSNSLIMSRERRGAALHTSRAGNQAPEGSFNSEEEGVIVDRPQDVSFFDMTVYCQILAFQQRVLRTYAPQRAPNGAASVSQDSSTQEIQDFQSKVRALADCLTVATKENTSVTEAKKKQAQAFFSDKYLKLKEEVEKSKILKAEVSSPTTEEGRMMEAWGNQYASKNGLKDNLRSVQLRDYIGRRECLSVIYIVNKDWKPADTTKFTGDWLAPTCTYEQANRDFRTYRGKIQVPLDPDPRFCQTYTKFVVRIPKAKLQAQGLYKMVLMRGKAEFLTNISFREQDGSTNVVPAGEGGGEGLMISDKSGADADKLRELVAEHTIMVMQESPQGYKRWSMKAGQAVIVEAVKYQVAQTIIAGAIQHPITLSPSGMFHHQGGDRSVLTPEEDTTPSPMPSA